MRNYWLNKKITETDECGDTWELEYFNGEQIIKRHSSEDTEGYLNKKLEFIIKGINQPLNIILTNKILARRILRKFLKSIGWV